MNIPGLSRAEFPLPAGISGHILRYQAHSPLASTADHPALCLDCWTFDELCALAGLDSSTAFEDLKNLSVHPGGWQSWSAGWELAGNETLPRKVRILPELIKLTNRDRDTAPPAATPFPVSDDALTGHFIMYLRSGDTYLCIASKEGGVLPPVTFRIDRRKRRVFAEIFSPGKTLPPGAPLAELSVFASEGYFAFKDTLAVIYGRLKLCAIGGYESWYNHYTDINEKLILDNLDSLNKTANIIKLWYIDQKKPVVFQIDDGWAQAVGDWEVSKKRFPNGLAPVAEKIASAGYIPGLWFAPFIVTRQARLYAEKPEWLLRDKSGAPVVAGFNPLWDKHYYCLDLSRPEVLAYIQSFIDRAIGEWGFRYLKLDFLYAGLLDGDFANSGSPWEHYEKACALLTSRTKTARGQPVTYLGCGVPLGPSYRHFPLSRIGSDTRETWDWPLAKLLGHVGRPGAYVNLMDTIGRAFLNGVVYINDPDVLFLRTKKCKLRKNEKLLIAVVNFLLGGQIMFSDDPLELTTADAALTRQVVSLYTELMDDEYGAVRTGRGMFRLESRSGRVTGVIDMRKHRIIITKDMRQLLWDEG
ncbi:MAG: alpha-galactosidase [Treponema sp.]|jgi:alpha-galactosidase|nr:alpha-galactosidase [Treponema sp.]